jgi:glycosyltransferase involved in cell wall biosynthesis
VTDEKMVEPMQQAFPDIEILFLPDTTLEKVSSSPLTKQISGNSKGRKIVGLLGMLHKRKGLLDAVNLAKKRTDIFFVFAGAYDLNKMTAEEAAVVQAFFDTPPENGFVHLERIAEEAEFNALVQQMDLIFAVYPNFTNSSGLLTKAGIFGKPILVAEGNTCMADRVRKYNLGLTTPSGNIQAQSDALDRLLTEETRISNAFQADFNKQALQSALNDLRKPL